MNRIKKGDNVQVIAGKERGKQGKVLGFTHDGQRVLVETLNIVKRHTRPTQTIPQGGIVEKEAGYPHLQRAAPHPERAAHTRRLPHERGR